MGWNPFAGNIPQTPAMQYVEAAAKDNKARNKGERETSLPSAQPAAGALDDAPKRESSSPPPRSSSASAPRAPLPSAITDRKPGLIERAQRRLTGG